MAPPRPLYLRVVRLSPAFASLVRSVDYPCFPNYDITAGERLVRRAFALHELPFLIEVIFSSQDEGDTIRRLLGDDPQAFVDVVYEVCPMSATYCEPVLN